MQNDFPLHSSLQKKEFFEELSKHLEQGGQASLSLDPSTGELKAQLKSRHGDLSAIDFLCGYLILAVEEVCKPSLGDSLHWSNTVQTVKKIRLKPDIGSFVQFDGDYTGLLIINLSGGAALSLYRAYMKQMGMPDEELANHFTSDEVRDSIGELVNQIIGQFRKKVEDRYGLQAQNSQPKAIQINESITLSIGPTHKDEQYRRLSFNINGDAFHIEFAFEQGQFNPVIIDPE